MYHYWRLTQLEMKANVKKKWVFREELKVSRVRADLTAPKPKGLDTSGLQSGLMGIRQYNALAGV